MAQLTLTTVTLDAPEPRALAEFYCRLLGYEIGTAESNWVTIGPPGSDGMRLAFKTESKYARPTWPAADGAQQMMIHLEIRVDDLDAAVAHAVAAGATVADFQPQDDVRVCLDPAGHPFCLWVP